MNRALGLADATQWMPGPQSYPVPHPQPHTLVREGLHDLPQEHLKTCGGPVVFLKSLSPCIQTCPAGQM